MKNHWIMFYIGIVTVKVTGKGIERFINHLTKSGILIWNVKRHGTAALTFKMRLPDVKKLRIASRKSECKIEFLHGGGLPFLLKRLWKNSGFIIGILLFFILIIYLSNTIWGIEIKGASPATEHQIRKELNQMGIKIGKLQFFLDDVESIQRELTNNVKAITWVGVELKGTTFHFQIVEKKEPKKSEYLSPRHLVAKKKAVIVDMFVEKGVPIVKVHEHVLPGQLLVSGTYGKEGKIVNVAAKGEILGETWYKSEVDLPLKSTFQVFNGNEKRKYYLKIGSLRINVWGFKKPEYSEYEKERHEKNIRFLKWNLPLSIETETIREREKVTRIYSNEDAIKMAKIAARNDLKNRLPEDAVIKGEKILHQSIENGKVNLVIHFQIIENIAQGQPIIQGD
ncbi:sporulation protein YqfD [Bacillus methanolicus]|uniref:Stage IV sporulation protein n=1 Tax=Bacillus methanolicus (strain MGA3 / ATCC 53907) TaxID=796606 RepID=I3EAM8_BACMM|nr:sporulation protein YqfD [Bacillus methanolicus]AIE60788.1 Putative stage IV sporulation protein [Bacillus methanolicus MGA3]EIJ83549.1 sporulation protein [Bacillus methanolicus MGA3]